MGVQPLEVSSVARSTEAAAFHGTGFLSRRIMKTTLFVVGDLVALSAAYCGAALLAHVIFHVAVSSLGPRDYPFFSIPFCAAVFYLVDGYGMADLRRPERELQVTFKAVSFGLLCLLAANGILLKGQPFSRYFLILWYFFALVFVLCTRFGLRGFYAACWRRGRALNRALFIGQENELGRFRELVTVQRHRAYQVVEAIVSDCAHSPYSAEDARIPFGCSAWERIVKEEKIQVVILGRSLCNSDNGVFREVMANSKQFNLNVTLLADTSYPAGMYRELDYFTQSSYLTPISRWHRGLQQACKRSIDLCFGLIGSLATLLLTPFVALLVNMEDPGPVFYRRPIVSCSGRTLYHWKFRTMVRDADQILQNDPNLKARFIKNQKLHDDPRILKVGRVLRKYSLDEFPQFFGILSGAFSLVGPRGISPEESIRYGDLLDKRLSVKPGITGYWQVMGRQMINYEDRVLMDEFYIDNWSLWLDLYIIGKTFSALLWPEGAY